MIARSLVLAAASLTPVLAHGATTEPPEALYYANAYADHYGVPREFVHAIITQESGWKQNIVSDRGAIGIMQLLPGTAARFGADPRVLDQNIAGGVRYLAFLQSEFHDLRLVAAAYYCGEQKIERRGWAYANPGVIAYVRSVESLYTRELKNERTQDANP